MGLPTTTFPDSVDPAIVQDANFPIDKYYVRYVDDQVRTLESYVLSALGGGSSADVQSIIVALPDTNTTLSNGAWAFGTIIFTGALTAVRTATAPTTVVTAPRKVVINKASKDVVLSPLAGGSSVTIPSGTAATIAFDGSSFFLVGGAVAFGTDIATIDSTNQAVIGLQRTPIDATAPTLKGSTVAFDPVSGKYFQRRLKSNELDSPFAPTLAIANGAAQTIEIGNNVSPTFTGSPAPNVVGVSSPVVHDDRAHSNAIVGGNPISPPTGLGGTFSSTVNGTVFNIWITETFGGDTADSNHIPFTFSNPIGFGKSSSPAATQGFIDTLMGAGKQFHTGRGGSYAFSLASGEFASFSIPAAYGTPTVKDANNLSYTPTAIGSPVAWVSSATNPQTISMQVWTVGAPGPGTPTYAMT